MKFILKTIKYISITLVVVFGAVLFILSRQVAGYRAFVVMTGSMEPTIHTGSLIITENVNPYLIREGDIVTFIRPDKTSEFITHRIVSIANAGRIPVFETKGDNNDSEDTWKLVGGGVVGKVIFSFSQLGYLLSLARTKIGIAILILLPSFLIIFDEIKTITTLLSRRKKMVAPDANLTIVSVAILVFTATTVSSSTFAYLSDSVSLEGNMYSVVINDPTITPTYTPTPTNTPSPTVTASPTVTTAPTPTKKPKRCGGDIEIDISGNSGGSNSVDIDIECKTIIKQTNNSSSSNTVVVQTTTGENKQ